MLTQHNRDGRWRNKISVGSWSTGNGDNRTREKNYTVLRRASVFKKKSPPPSNDDWQSHWSSPYSARQDPSPTTIRCTPLHFLLHCHSFPQIPLSNTQISLKSLSLSLPLTLCVASSPPATLYSSISLGLRFAPRKSRSRQTTTSNYTICFSKQASNSILSRGSKTESQSYF